jgi:hypothetical protein
MVVVVVVEEEGALQQLQQQKHKMRDLMDLAEAVEVAKYHLFLFLDLYHVLYRAPSPFRVNFVFLAFLYCL